MVYIHKTHTPNNQRKITLERVSYYENKWYPPFTILIAPPFLLEKSEWTPPFFFKNFENSPPPPPRFSCKTNDTDRNSVMVYIHKINTRNNQRKITLERVSYYENKWYPLIHHFTSPSLFWKNLNEPPPPPFFFKNFENWLLPPPLPSYL